jgi:hypothetical protein
MQLADWSGKGIHVNVDPDCIKTPLCTLIPMSHSVGKRTRNLQSKKKVIPIAEPFVANLQTGCGFSSLSVYLKQILLATGEDSSTN